MHLIENASTPSPLYIHLPQPVASRKSTTWFDIAKNCCISLTLSYTPLTNPMNNSRSHPFIMLILSTTQHFFSITYILGKTFLKVIWPHQQSFQKSFVPISNHSLKKITKLNTCIAQLTFDQRWFVNIQSNIFNWLLGD